MRPTILSVVLSLVCILGGCASPSWNGQVHRWGTLRGVLRDGDTGGKVRLGDAVEPDCVGIGALEGLAGEIGIVDGKLWVARADDEAAADSADSDAMATFLATATVPRWVRQETHERLSLAQLEKVVHAAAMEHGLDTSAPFPILIEGRFSTVNLHVLNGRCPFKQPPDPSDDAHDPVRYEQDTARGVLVGFYNEGPSGILTHANTKLHLHAVLRDAPPPVGHVDALTIDPGAEIRIPAVD
ncbi:MAG: hypothetical protein D6744_03520 [Planctomycetota bacterium]|nr:MAG: hypothetical protein D6744_03520 [Planctomycetota bacterium]